MKYQLFFDQPHQQKIRIQLSVPASGDAPVEVWQPAWRPGRYELASYAERVTDVSAATQSGKPLAVTKSAYNHWVIEPTGQDEAVFEYAYYANVKDAGGSWFDDQQVYFNGVNLFLYFPDAIGEPCEATLHLPDTYRVACGLAQRGNTLLADDFHQLVDAPLIASASLHHHTYEANGITFHLWFQGNVKPDWEKLTADFTPFSQTQLDLFGSFPVNEYHFLFQIHNRDFYHGVEHYNSTIIALGPGYRIFENDLYEELLGVSCHELFHTWNVKAIRPADMLPYDYDRENYSRLHYVTEGVTTYYGDLLLFKSGVWNLNDYLRVFNNSLLKRYYQNDGRNHISLESASFDSWVNGYKAAVPNRRISFYTKGALVAFLADIKVRKATENRHSLDTVMRRLWEDYGQKNRGYTREAYQNLLEEVSGEDFSRFFELYISGTEPLEPALAEAADYLGLLYESRLYPDFDGNYLGFLTEHKDRYAVVKQVFENGPADRAGLAKGDEIIAVNGLKAFPKHMQRLIRHNLEEKEIRLHVFRGDEMRKIVIPRETTHTQPFFKLSMAPDMSPAQMANLKAWGEVRV